MKPYLYIALLAILTACAGPTGDPGQQGEPGPQGPTAPTPQVTAVQDIVNSENAYRETQGQAPLTSGLSCTVQAIASGTYLSSASPGYTAAQAIVMTGPSYSYLLSSAVNQANAAGSAGNSLINAAIRPLFLSNNYRVVCTGALVVTEDGYHNFSTSSDDGSLLYIDGTLVVDNDGSHGMQTMSGTKLLEAAVTHTFQMYYAQSAAGNIGMVLNMDGALLPAANLYH